MRAEGLPFSLTSWRHRSEYDMRMNASRRAEGAVLHQNLIAQRNCRCSLRECMQNLLRTGRFSVTRLNCFLTGLYFRFVEENRIALANLQKEAKLLKERELAGGVQKSLFPDIARFENFIYAKNVPARDVSGDYYDVVKVGKSEYFFTLTCFGN